MTAVLQRLRAVSPHAESTSLDALAAGTDGLNKLRAHIAMLIEREGAMHNALVRLRNALGAELRFLDKVMSCHIRWGRAAYIRTHFRLGPFRRPAVARSRGIA